MNNAPQLAKAVLIPMIDNSPDSDENNHIKVQFNPETLKVTLSNSLKADNQGGNNSTAAQYIDKSESSLSVELLFDTTAAPAHQDALLHNCSQSGGDTQSAPASPEVANGRAMDVRAQTRCIADKFMKSPDDPETTEQPAAPPRCRFQWGSFVFVGMLSSYNETLEFFSPEGIPLRAKLSLSFKESRYQFEQLDTGAASRPPPTFTPAAANLPKTLSDQAKDPKKWRDAALFNGIENPRLNLSLGVSLPSVSVKASAGLSGSLSAAAGIGLNAGASASLGTSVPGAFVEVKPPSVDIKAAANLGLSAGASLTAGVNAGVGAGINAGIGAGLNAGVNASANPGGGANVSANVSGPQASIRIRS